ncbi:hypothetical protein KR76_00062 [Pimelobacter simplex]|uniref:Uncharacterized protein n=1 Tax=Nocardioides simplex TaxID=2045 RepID=A0A0C5XL56_NOCSI|nr:hypothetical protein KR76_00062 [Pimelobacter simplex]
MSPSLRAFLGPDPPTERSLGGRKCCTRHTPGEGVRVRSRPESAVRGSREGRAGYLTSASLRPDRKAG